MKTFSDYLLSKVTRVGLAIAVGTMLAAGVAVAPAAAQGRYDDRQDRRMSSSDIRRIAAVNGYSEGFEDGIRARRDRAGLNYRNSDRYRQGTSGYDSGWGTPRDYQNAFRQGYAKGFSDGYYGRARSRSYERGRDDYRYSPNDRSPGYGGSSYGNNGAYYNGRYYDNRRGDLDPEEIARRAAQQGYYDGFQRGQYDLRIGARQPKPQGHGAYELGLNGWNPEWGSALTFQQYYRQYFIQGYQDGFGRRQMNRQYSRRWW